MGPPTPEERGTLACDCIRACCDVIVYQSGPAIRQSISLSVYRSLIFTGYLFLSIHVSIYKLTTIDASDPTHPLRSVTTSDKTFATHTTNQTCQSLQKNPLVRLHAPLLLPVPVPVPVRERRPAPVDDSPEGPLCPASTSVSLRDPTSTL